MKTVAIAKAKDHLDLARQAVADMDIERGFKTYEQAWSQFLSQVSRFYSKLEQGSKGCGQSEGWFGRKKHERRKDSLLSYLHHARDCDEHSIAYITARAVDGLRAKFPPTNELKLSFYMKHNDDGSFEIKDQKVESPNGGITSIEVQNPRVKLLTVKDERFGDKFSPPNGHLGQPLSDPSPLEVANLALVYLDQMLNEASKLPQRV